MNQGTSKDSNELLDSLLELSDDECLDELVGFTEQQHREITTHWQLWARSSQLAPKGDWRTWLIMAGRGFGKTRAGAEWIRSTAEADPNARIALVGASFSEARAVMVEGDSGLLAISAPARRPTFEPSLRRIIWPNGAQAMLYSALEPEALRGPQHSHACRTGPERDPRQRSPCLSRRHPALCGKR
jgi:phage terminase large subunit-like protein